MSFRPAVYVLGENKSQCVASVTKGNEDVPSTRSSNKAPSVTSFSVNCGKHTDDNNHHHRTVRVPSCREKKGSIGGGFSRTETLILFDWDDTLLPSSWLASRKYGVDVNSPPPTTKDQEYLNAISAQVSMLLEAAVHLGRVIVVTNAEAGWVEVSSARFMPGVLETLNIWHISVVSARTEFRAVKRQLPVEWKAKAFQHLLTLAYSDSKTRKNILSIGDSNSERVALIQSFEKLDRDQQKSALYKSLKLCEQPNLGLLHRQLMLVYRFLSAIVRHKANLDLRVNFQDFVGTATSTVTATKGSSPLKTVSGTRRRRSSTMQQHLATTNIF